MTPTTPHVAAVSGSLRDPSITHLALRTALEGARSRGATTDLLDLRELHVPLLDPSEPPSPDVGEMQERTERADAILLGTPVYHGSYSSILKAALDHCGFREFEGKTVGLVAVSGGPFPVPALEHLRTVCRALHAWVLPDQVAVPRSDSATEEGDLTRRQEVDRLHELGELATAYARIRPTLPPEDPQNLSILPTP